jgi:hypothetical protein
MMTADNEYRDLVLKLGRGHHRETAPANRFRESIDTMILGSLSIAIGLVIAALLLWRIAPRAPGQRWFESLYANQTLGTNTLLACALTAVVGEWLGIAGAILAKSRGWLFLSLCLLGSVLCVVATVLARSPKVKELGPNLMFLGLVIVPPTMLHYGVSLVKKKDDVKHKEETEALD